MLAGKNLMSPSDLTIQELDELFVLTDDLIKNPQQYSDVCRGKSLSTLFFEPSTRTRLSFEAAMHRLGGGVFGFSDPGSSSATKGETVADTARMIGCYADIVAMRHPNEGAPQAAALYCNVPVINAGDGGHQHPTQTLTDLYTIRTAKGRLDHLVVGLCGDLKFGRTVHSLIQALCRYEEITFVCISPKELVLPDYIYAQIPKDARVSFEITENSEEVIDKLDVCYMTRVQKERFDNEQDYLRLKDVYILDTEKMEKAKQDMIVLHPLPRVGEIKTAVDSDPRAMYFAQAQYGMYVRMALICKLLGVLENQPALGGKMHLTQKPNLKDSHPHLRCANPKCLCNVQTTLPKLFCESNDKLTCYYCDHEGEPI